VPQPTAPPCAPFVCDKQYQFIRATLNSFLRYTAHCYLHIKVGKVFPLEAMGRRGISPLILNLSIRWRLLGQRNAPAALPPRKNPDTLCTEGCVGSRAGLDV